MSAAYFPIFVAPERSQKLPIGGEPLSTTHAQNDNRWLSEEIRSSADERNVKGFCVDLLNTVSSSGS